MDLVIMARPERFELPTYSSGGCRSIQLSYGRVVQVYIGRLGPSIYAGAGGEMPRMVQTERSCQSLAVRVSSHNTARIVHSTGVRRLRDRRCWPVQPWDALRSH